MATFGLLKVPYLWPVLPAVNIFRSGHIWPSQGYHLFALFTRRELKGVATFGLLKVAIYLVLC